MQKLFGIDKNKTFRPKKGFAQGTKRYDLHRFAQATLGSGDIKGAVKLPAGEDRNEWIAANTVDLFNEVNLLYGTIQEFCSKESCPVMSAGSKYEYYWADGNKIKTPIKVSAPEYVDYLMTWVDEILTNPSIFPTDFDTDYPKDFIKYIQTIFKRLFRIYAHIYYSHFDKIVSIQAEAHLNTCFKHFYFFSNEFNLIPEKELEPLKDLIEKLCV